MTTYNVNFTDSTKQPIDIQETEIDTSTDIALFGRQRLQYGAEMNQNMLSLLENFAVPEDPTRPGNPNLTLTDGSLASPIMGQIWYNPTKKTPYVFNGTRWVSLLSSGSIASNWGIISNGQQIPAPVGSDGYQFSYNECVWIVGPYTTGTELFNFEIDTDAFANVTAQCNGGTQMVVNYLIVGIRGNSNAGTLSPQPAPTVTPTISITPSASPPSVALSSGLVSYWDFTDGGASPTFIDAIGTNNFTRTGAVATTLPASPPYDKAHGVIGPAIRAGNTSYFEAQTTSNMSAGTGASYTFGGWFSINPTIASYTNLIQRGVFGTPGQRSFTLTYTASTDSLALYKSADGTSYEFVQTPSNLGLADGNWHFVVAWVDAVKLTLNIQVDNGIVHSSPMVSSTTYNIGTLKLGSSTGIPLQSAVDALFYYNRAINASERTALFNNGQGLSSSSASGLTPASPTPTATPTPTPPPTPTLHALTISLSQHVIQSTCAGPNCEAGSPPIVATIQGGVFTQNINRLTWIYVAGDPAFVSALNRVWVQFSRNGSAVNGVPTVLTGFYRARIQDDTGTVAYSALLEFQTTHT